MSSETISSGTKANKTGDRLQKFVSDTLKQSGYTEFAGNKRQLFKSRTAIGGKQFSTNVHVGETIYGTRRMVDFLILNEKKFPGSMIIECKWQQSPGSVDEKYPFLLYNIQKTGTRTIVLLDGGGYKDGAKAWLEAQVDAENGPLMGVWNMQEFQTRVNNDFLG